MRPRITNILAETLDVHRFRFESAGALGFDNKYSEFVPFQLLHHVPVKGTDARFPRRCQHASVINSDGLDARLNLRYDTHVFCHDLLFELSHSATSVIVGW